MKKIVIIFTLLVTSIAFSHARILYVATTGNDSNDGLSLEEAFASLERGFLDLMDEDTIKIAPGTYTIHHTLEWSNKSISILGAGAENTIIQATTLDSDSQGLYGFSLLYNMPSRNCENKTFLSIIDGITLKGGYAPISEPIPLGMGGAIKNFAQLEVKNCLITENYALNGGAIYNEGKLTVVNTIISNNNAKNLGGAIFNTSYATYTEGNGVIFENNTEEKVYNKTYIISDFENGYSGAHGSNGNGDGGYVTDGANHTIVDNPMPSDLNPSQKVAKFHRLKSGNWWAYAWFEFPEIKVDAVPYYLHIMIHKPVLSTVCIQVKDQHSNPVSNTFEMKSDAQNVVNKWQDLVFEITNTGTYKYIEVKADFVNQAPNTRLVKDIDIYFDNIIINGSPEPRITADPSSEHEAMIGVYEFPLSTSSFTATTINKDVVMSDLDYTSNLGYDYNPNMGYFRPYLWPLEELDPERYLSFEVIPNDNIEMTLNKFKIIHRPNTPILGPSKVQISYSINHGDSFQNFSPITFDPNTRNELTTSELDMGELITSQPVQFRLYAYESLQATGKKDFWIIDQIKLFGTTKGLINSNIPSEVNNATTFYIMEEKLVAQGLPNNTLVTIYNITGNRLTSQMVTNDGSMAFPYPKGCYLIEWWKDGERYILKIMNQK